MTNRLHLIFLLVLLCASGAKASSEDAPTKITAVNQHVVGEVSCGSSGSSMEDSTQGECPAGLGNIESHKPSILQKAKLTVRQFMQSASATVPTYYLIWSPGATKKLVSSSLWLAVIHVYRDFLFGSNVQALVNNVQIPGISILVHNLLLPLLSSACCALQLILNVLGVGCAGFNSYLGPLRPYFLSLMLYLSLVVATPTVSLSSLATFGARITLALLPELVHFYNTYTTSSSSYIHNNPLLTESHLPPSPIHATVEFVVPTMGCVACVNKINASLLKLQQEQQKQSVADGKSWLVAAPEKGGRASVTLMASNEAELQSLIQQIQTNMHQAGFDNTSVHSIVRRQQQEQQVLGTATTDEALQTRGGGATSTRSNELPLSTIPIPHLQIDMEIPNMSCDGCIAEVNTAIRQALPNILDTKSWLKEDYDGGFATVTLKNVASKRQLDAAIQELQRSLEASGFDGNTIAQMEFLVPSSSSTSPSSTVKKAQVEMSIPNMSCGGCIQEVNTAIRQAPSTKIQNVESWLSEDYNGGFATIDLSVSNEVELDAVLKEMQRSLEATGFDDNKVTSAKFVESSVPATKPALTVSVRWNIPSMSCGGCIREIDASVRDILAPLAPHELQSQLLEEGEGNGGTTVLTFPAASLDDMERRLHALEDGIRSRGFHDLERASLDWQLW